MAAAVIVETANFPRMEPNSRAQQGKEEGKEKK
jgi:hypothetical protein